MTTPVNFAFPRTYGNPEFGGMTYRQFLLGKILQGMASNPAVVAMDPGAMVDIALSMAIAGSSALDKLDLGMDGTDA